MRKPTIAVVDDDPDFPVAISSLLRALGYDVQCFQSAKALLASPYLRTFACVISDVHMPQMSGIELVRTLSDEISELPAILMSGRPDPGLETRARENGARSFLVKPFQIAELQTSIKTAIGR